MELTEKNYFSKEADTKYCSVSQLKKFISCDAKALAVLKGEYDEVIPPSTQKAFLLGSYVDCMLLEPEKKAQFEAEHPELFKKGGELYADYVNAPQMVEVAKNDKEFMKALEGEHQKIYTGEIFGVPFKIKVDAINENRITDLKTTASITATEWYAPTGQRENFVIRYDYVLQGAIYQEIVRQNTGDKLPFFLAVLSKESITDKALIYIDDDSLAERLQWAMPYIIHTGMLKSGDAEPTKCGHCDFCTKTKVITEAIHYKDIGKEER